MSFVILAFITTKQGTLRVVTRECHNRSIHNTTEATEYNQSDPLYSQFKLLESLSIRQVLKAGNAYEIVGTQVVSVGDICELHKYSQPIPLLKLLNNGETATALTKKRGAYQQVAKIAHTVILV